MAIRMRCTLSISSGWTPSSLFIADSVLMSAVVNLQPESPRLHVADDVHERKDRDGLDDIACRAQHPRRVLRFFVVRLREHHELRSIEILVMLADLFDQLEARHPRYVEVDQNEPRTLNMSGMEPHQQLFPTREVGDRVIDQVLDLRANHPTI